MNCDTFTLLYMYNSRCISMIVITGWKSSPPVGEEGIGAKTKLRNGNQNGTTERKCNQKREFTSRRA